MRDGLLKLLCCPVCRKDLALAVREREGPHILSGALCCPECRRNYPILDGVPRLLPDTLPADMAFTAKNFGASWKLWKEIHDERYTWQFLRWVQPLQPADFQNRTVLDCGCGKGRHLRVVQAFGCQEAVGVDLSVAAEVAFANTRELENVHVVQGDILRLPLKGGFDLAYSVGVLHHTPDPAVSFESMAGQVRPGGQVCCWVYGRENNGWIVHLVNPLRLGLTRHLPSAVVRALAWVLACMLFVGIHAVCVPLAALGVRFSYSEYLLYLRELGFRETRHIVYDHLTAPTAAYLTRADVLRWFERLGITERTLSWVRGVSWAGVGRKPSAAEKEAQAPKP